MNPIAESEKTAADPFAADIFASDTHDVDGRETDADFFALAARQDRAERTVSWSDALPQVARSTAGWDELWRRLPNVFFDEMPRRLSEKLAQLLDFPDENAIEFRFVGKREITNVNDFAAENSALENFWWLTVGTGDAAEIAVAIDDAFAVRLIDAALLGADDGGAAILRALTPTEIAIIEFFALNLANEANNVLEKPQFRFRRISRQIPERLRQTTETQNFSLLALEWQTIGEFVPPSIVKIYLAPEMLDSLQSKNTGENSRRRSAKINSPTAENVRARLFCGSVDLNFGELAALEAGDVLLLEHHGLFVSNERLAGRAEIFCGDGDNQKLAGELVVSFEPDGESFGESGSNAGNKIAVRSLNFKRSPQIAIAEFAETDFVSNDNFMIETNDRSTAEFAGDETAENEDEQTGGLAVENLVVSLRVELDARRLTLAEIAALRENQTLELGIKPTDEVNILVDERVVGRGELVAVEDRLGVRITKLMR